MIHARTGVCLPGARHFAQAIQQPATSGTAGLMLKQRLWLRACPAPCPEPSGQRHDYRTKSALPRALPRFQGSRIWHHSRTLASGKYWFDRKLRSGWRWRARASWPALRLLSITPVPKRLSCVHKSPCGNARVRQAFQGHLGRQAGQRGEAGSPLRPSSSSSVAMSSACSSSWARMPSIMRRVVGSSLPR